MMTTLDGFPVPVAVAGPEKGVVVVIVGDDQRAPAAYDAVCERLHTASLRTVVIGRDPRLTPKSVVGILDALGIAWAVVVGDRAGGGPRREVRNQHNRHYQPGDQSADQGEPTSRATRRELRRAVPAAPGNL